MGAYRLTSLYAVVSPSFLPVTDKHGRLVGTYTNLGIGRFLCSVSHLRNLKKVRCLDINILGKQELQTMQQLIVEEYSRTSQKAIQALEKKISSEIEIIGTSQDERLTLVAMKAWLYTHCFPICP